MITSAPATGVFAISITPFNENGALDEDALRRHVGRLADGGVGIYVSGGGSGEAYSLTPAERIKVVELAVDEVGSRSEVRAMGVEPRTAEEMIGFARGASGAGAGAVQIYSLDLGHGRAPSSREIEIYLRTVIDAVDGPVVLSTHRAAGYSISPTLLRELALEYKSLIGINCTQNDLAYVQAIIDSVPKGVTVHVGGPSQALAALCLGADGFLSTEANIAPGMCRDVVDAFWASDGPRLKASYGRLLRLSSVLYGSGGVRATKAALRHLGFPGGFPRLPRTDLEDTELTLLTDAIDQLNLYEVELAQEGDHR